MELRLEPRTPPLHSSGELSPGLVNKCGEMVCVFLLPSPSGQGTGCWGKKGERGGWRRAGVGGSPAHVKAEIKKKYKPRDSPRPTPQVQAAKGQVQVRFRPRSGRLRLQSVREPPGGAPAILARARGSGGQSSRGGGRGANATQTCKKTKID